MKRLGLHRVDGRAYWFAGYFNPFDRDRMVQYAGEGRADRFRETFDEQLPFSGARIVTVYDEDRAAAEQFAATFNVAVASSLDEFAEGLDGVIVPFPSGGPLRDYAVTAPLARRGLPLFLDRLILEQSAVLCALMDECAPRRVPLHVTCFMRYFAEQLLPPECPRAECVVATAHGDPSGYGADLLDLIDGVMQGEPVSIMNTGNAQADIVRIRYADGRHAILQLFRHAHPAMHVAAYGDGWSRAMPIDGTQFHFGAFRQFAAFLQSLETREPPVPYTRIRAQAAILHAIAARVFNCEMPLQ